MSRLKYTRKRSNMIRVSNATRYLGNSRSVVPDIFRYFFDLHVFTPWTWLDVDDLAAMLEVSRVTALKRIREIQHEYKRPRYNYVTTKDLCRFHKFDMSDIQMYFYHVDMHDFHRRAKKLKHR